MENSRNHFNNQTATSPERVVIEEEPNFDKNDNDKKINKLKKQKETYNYVEESDYIPCLFIRGTSKKVMIHFHANGEDLSHT